MCGKLYLYIYFILFTYFMCIFVYFLFIVMLSFYFIDIMQLMTLMMRMFESERQAYV